MPQAKWPLNLTRLPLNARSRALRMTGPHHLPGHTYSVGLSSAAEDVGPPRQLDTEYSRSASVI